MNIDQRALAARSSAFLAWLRRVNTQVSQWAASMSWWRLLLLFLLILMAGSILSEVLHLNHERVRVVHTRGGQIITIGPGGVRIVRDPQARSATAPESGASAATGGASGAAEDVAGHVAAEIRKNLQDMNDDTIASRRVVTFRGVLGDIGSAALVLLFAYLTASKIIVKKVAQADAKVRTAQDTAERETMERQLAQARLQVLQAQVEPHFLFNTLAAVDYLIETDPPRASKMQKALITYLRGALPQMRQESSTVGRELQLATSYLDLIKMRVEERLEVEIAVPDALRGAQFPPMMLQSLVENAIKHGIEPKPQGGKVRIAAALQNGLLRVEVSDTGVGIPDDDVLERPTAGTGLGLGNIRERLAMLYGPSGTLMLRSDPDKGTLVRITVPFRTAPDPAAGAAMPQGNFA